jgi:hypothetical protein
MVSKDKEEAIRTIIAFKDYQEQRVEQGSNGNRPARLPLHDQARSGRNPQHPLLPVGSTLPLPVEHEETVPEVAENCYDAIVRFNEDMKILAMNACQMNELLRYALQENHLIKDWTNKLEQNTAQAEDAILLLSNDKSTHTLTN